VRLTVFLLGIAWSVIFYLGTRTLSAMEKKMDANFERIEQTNRALRSSLERGEKRMRHEARAWQKNTAKQFSRMKAVTDRNIAANNKALQKMFVTRQEFGSLVANINHKIDSIYETLNNEKTGADRI